MRLSKWAPAVFLPYVSLSVAPRHSIGSAIMLRIYRKDEIAEQDAEAAKKPRRSPAKKTAQRSAKKETKEIQEPDADKADEKDAQ